MVQASWACPNMDKYQPGQLLRRLVKHSKEAHTFASHHDLSCAAADRMPSAKHLEEANAALTQWLSPEHCGHLVSAVISKYIALTPEELQEWQVNTLSCLEFPFSLLRSSIIVVACT